MRKALVLLLVVALAMVVAAPVAFAVQPEKGKPSQPGLGVDDLPNPLAEKQAELREEALAQRLKGGGQGEVGTLRAAGGDKVARVGKGQYVELAREDTDRVFVVIAEFGDEADPTYGGTPGPLHNQIPKPRPDDNSTIWQPDYDKAHYEELYFSDEPGADSMVNYYDEQSSGRYTIEGDVTEWVRVPYNSARYGTNDCDADGDDDGDNEPNDPDSSVCSTVWLLIRDAINKWTRDQISSGKSRAEVERYLDTFDVWDRYDQDGDGNFDEQDGYIDHFQIVHAGEGEETGGGAHGPDAIWSHRWYANYSAAGQTGPRDFTKQGGYKFGNTDVWVGDYTIQPENGGLGVFAHEYGHDLGLPDHYDTSYLGESPSAFWNIMASGSYLNRGEKDALGTRPGHMMAWDKLQLGWLNYEVAQAGERSTHRVGPAEYNTKAAQALITVLPDRERTTEVNAPFAGRYEWWSGSGDNLNNTLSRTVDLAGRSQASVAMKAWYDIEAGYDYLYAEVSEDGTNWTALDGTANGQPIGDDGVKPALSGSSNGEWVDLAYDLTPYAGGSVQFRLRYATDGGVAPKGFAADEIVITADGQPVFTDGAEGGEAGWTADGFRRITGSFTESYPNFYIAENRQYLGFDKTLRTGPYNFVTDVNADRFPYQNGLLVSYWNTAFNDNNVGEHPGEGLVLPIDSHPKPLLQANGTPWRTRVQVYDAPFGVEKTDRLSLRTTGGIQSIPSQPAVRTFDDRRPYWYASDPDAGVKVPNTGTTISVKGQSNGGSFMQVEVRPAR